MRNVKSFKKLLAAGMAIVTIAMTPTGVFAEELPGDEYVSGSETVVEEYADDSEAVIEEEYADDSDTVVEEEYADDSEAVVEEEYADDSEIVVEEEYADDSEALNKEIAEEDEVVCAVPVYTEDEAVNFIRNQYVNRNNSFSFSIMKVNGSYPSYTTLSNRAMAYSESCSGVEGDYLAHSGISGGPIVSVTSDRVTYTCNYNYWTTYDQEQALTKEVNAAIAGLNLDGKSEYEKVVAIHNYICNRVDYDYDNLGNNSYTLKQTAYAAMINRTSVCEGYASLFYRMAKKAGLSVRIITGESRNERHAWNIVKIGDLYYNIDTTWDGQDVETRDSYLTRGYKDFPNHTSDYEFTISEFTSAYPISEFKYGWRLEKANEDNPILQFTDIKGNKLSTAANNKPTIVILFGYRCPNSRSVIRDLDKLIAMYDVNIYAFESQNATSAELTDFINTYASADTKINFVDWNGGAEVRNYYHGKTGMANVGNILPFVAYIDADNKIQYFSGGMVDANTLGVYLETYCGAVRKSIPIKITKQPSYDAYNENIISIEIMAEGYQLSYYWEESTDDGKTWVGAETAYSAHSRYTYLYYSVKNSKKLYRCKITDGDGQYVYSENFQFEYSYSGPKYTLLGGYATVGNTVNMTVWIKPEINADLTDAYFYTNIDGIENMQSFADAYSNYSDYVGTYYFFSIKVPIKDMNDSINLYVCEGVNSKKIYVSSFSFASYLKAIMKDEYNEYTDKEKKVSTALLNYGGYAQEYFNYNTEALVNAGMYTQANDPVLTTNIAIDSTYANTVLADNAYLEYVGCSLVCNSTTGMKLYFKEKQNISISGSGITYKSNGTTFSYNKQSYEIYEEGGFLIVYLKSISYTNLDKEYNVNLKINNVYLTAKCSPFGYIYNAQNSNNDKLKNLTKAMWLVYRAYAA